MALVQKLVVHDASEASPLLPQHVALVNEDGTEFSGGGSYTLPSSDVSTLGGVKVSAQNLGGMNAVDTYINDGVIKGRVPNASSGTPGLVKQAAHVDGASGTVQQVVDALVAAGIMAGA